MISRTVRENYSRFLSPAFKSQSVLPPQELVLDPKFALGSVNTQNSYAWRIASGGITKPVRRLKFSHDRPQTAFSHKSLQRPTPPRNCTKRKGHGHIRVYGISSLVYELPKMSPKFSFCGSLPTTCRAFQLYKGNTQKCACNILLQMAFQHRQKNARTQHSSSGSVAERRGKQSQFLITMILRI